MAEILLITGKPGAGKSLLAITRGLDFVKQGRPVYVQGFNEIDRDATGFNDLPHDFAAYDATEKDDKGRQLVKWQTLPSGSVIMLDECYDYIPQRAAGKAVPPHVDALARHRHYNIDLIFVTQKHEQIDGFVKGLVGTHIHVKNPFGFAWATLKTWNEFQGNTKLPALTAPKWRYPKKNFALYKSATAHTVKKRVPWFLWAVPVLIALIASCGYYVKHAFGKQGQAVTGASATGAAVPSGVRGTADRDADDGLRRSDYARWITPRVPGQPWTAPAFDRLQVKALPELYCIAVDDGRCSCYTEQGTPYQLDARVCRRTARDGSYNPFREPLVRRDDRRREDGRRDRSADAESSTADPDGVTAVTAGAGSGLQRGPSFDRVYVPPEYQTPAAAGAFTQ